MSAPSVYVLVINWNGLHHLEACFESLQDCTHENVKFVLVDNASDDGSVDFVRKNLGGDPRVEILECGANLGWSHGNNVGIRHALERGADYILLLNNDTGVEAGAIEALVEMAEEDDSVGALSPKILLYDSPELLNSVGLAASRIGASWDIGIGRVDAPRWDQPRDILGVCGAAFFIRASVLEKTGLLPEDFDIYLDDLDLSLRIWNAGYRISICSHSRIRHKFSATMGAGKSARRKYYLNTRNRARVIMRNFPISKLPEVKIRFAVGECRSIGRAALDGEYWRIAAHVRSWIAAMGYGFSALRHRRDMKRRGIGRCRFWSMLLAEPAFFPGIEFPKHGWYEERKIDGKRVRPMAPAASWDHSGGAITIYAVHPFPELGPQTIRVLRDGELLAQLDTTEGHEWKFDWTEGKLLFVADTVFDAEDIGELIDIGGWIGIR